MKSRYGLWIISICWIGLAGCSNWQNRTTNVNGAGSVAGFSAAPAPVSPMLSGPDPAFGEPPPPVPPAPSDPNMTLAPLGSAPARLDLSAAAPAPAPAPQKMYNLDSSTKPAVSKASSSSAAKSGSGSSTISRLAGKAKPSESASAAPVAKKPGGSAIERLSADASKSRSSETNETPVAVKQEDAPDSGPSDSMIDTALLAQPVRKGTDSGSSSGSKNGPQSSLLPGDVKLFNGSKKPLIYPVSNPAAEEPVDITQFS